MPTHRASRDAGMSVPSTAAELIDHILTRFHETHRRELPGIVALARELEGKGATPTLADDLDVMAKALEMHMFKEEMRLFPMMEQGGNTLIVHLIDDMQAEHLDHADVVAELEHRMADLVAPAGTEPDVAALPSPSCSTTWRSTCSSKRRCCSLCSKRGRRLDGLRGRRAAQRGT